MASPDQGSILTVSGTDIATTYVAAGTGTTKQLGACSIVRVMPLIVLSSGTSVTGLKCKLQASYNGTNWFDLASNLDDGTAVGTVEVEHTYTQSANSTAQYSFSLREPRCIPNLRVLAKSTGAAGQAGDSFTFYAIAW